jgi:hypothetical protein
MSYIRIAMIRKPDDTLLIKSFVAEDLEDAQQAACNWVAKNFSRDDDMRIMYPEYFLPVAEDYVTTHAERADTPVVHSRVLSEDDREFLTGCRISSEGL